MRLAIHVIKGSCKHTSHNPAIIPRQTYGIGLNPGTTMCSDTVCPDNKHGVQFYTTDLLQMYETYFLRRNMHRYLMFYIFNVVYIYMYIHIYIYTYVCVYVCVCPMKPAHFQWMRSFTLVSSGDISLAILKIPMNLHKIRANETEEYMYSFTVTTVSPDSLSRLGYHKAHSFKWLMRRVCMEKVQD